MADAFGSISLIELLIRLLVDHVPKEVAHQEARHQHTKDSTRYLWEAQSDPPAWQHTCWDAAIRWLAQRSAYFHNIEPVDIAGTDSEAIDVYEHQIRKYLSDVKGGGPTQSNPAAAELLEFERQGFVAQLCKALGADLPADIRQQLVALEEANNTPPSDIGQMLDGVLSLLLNPDISDAIAAADASAYRPGEESAVSISGERSAAPPEQTTQTGHSSGDDAMRRLLNLFTDGMSDDRFHTALGILQNDNLSTDEKLKAIDVAIRLPAIASAEKLGQLLGVSKQAVLKTDWWTQNRKGEKADEVGRRHQQHVERANQNEVNQPSDDDE